VVEASALFCIQRLDALAYLLIQGMVGMVWLSWTKHGVRRMRRGDLAIRPWLSLHQRPILGGGIRLDGILTALALRADPQAPQLCSAQRELGPDAGELA